MKAHFGNLKYILRHKWFVLLAGLKLGVPIHQLIIHDYDKFLPVMWGPYVDRFFKKPPQSREGYYHNPELANVRFNTAWLSHLNRQKHHWQHWLLQYDDGDFLVLPIPDRFIREMVADWSGAGKAQGHGNDVSPWYAKNKDRMKLHPETRVAVEGYIAKLAQGAR